MSTTRMKKSMLNPATFYTDEKANIAVRDFSPKGERTVTVYTTDVNFQRVEQNNQVIISSQNRPDNAVISQFPLHNKIPCYLQFLNHVKAISQKPISPIVTNAICSDTPKSLEAAMQELGCKKIKRP